MTNRVAELSLTITRLPVILSPLLSFAQKTRFFFQGEWSCEWEKAGASMRDYQRFAKQFIQLIIFITFNKFMFLDFLFLKFGERK